MVDFARVRDNEVGGEAAVTVEMVRHLRSHPLVGDSLQAAVGDKAWRGAHHRLMLQLGVLSVSPMPAAKKARDGNPRVPKRSTIGGSWHRAGQEKGEPVDITLLDGHPHFREVDVDGEIHDRLLERVQSKRKELRRSGSFTWYSVYAVPDDLGGGQVWLRHLSDNDDHKNDKNREENLRVISPYDPDYPAIHGRRQDSESLNDLIEQTNWKNRAHSYGDDRQFLDLFGLAMAMAVTTPEAYRRSQLRRRPAAA